MSEDGTKAILTWLGWPGGRQPSFGGPSSHAEASLFRSPVCRQCPCLVGMSEGELSTFHWKGPDPHLWNRCPIQIRRNLQISLFLPCCYAVVSPEDAPELDFKVCVVLIEGLLLCSFGIIAPPNYMEIDLGVSHKILIVHIGHSRRWKLFTSCEFLAKHLWQMKAFVAYTFLSSKREGKSGQLTDFQGEMHSAL